MNKKIDLNIFDDADDRIIEKFSSTPILSKEEKERIFAQSQKKLKKRITKDKAEFPVKHLGYMNKEEKIMMNKRESNTEAIPKKEIKISRYKSIISAAACLVVVASVSGVLFSVKNANKDSDNKAPLMSKSKVTTVSQNMPSTETESESSSDTESADDESSVVTENSNSQTDVSQYISIANQIKDNIQTLFLMCSGGGVTYDDSHEPYYITYHKSDLSYFYDGSTIVPEFFLEAPNEEDIMLKYTYVNDPRFKSTADIRNLIENTYTENYLNSEGDYENNILGLYYPNFVDYNGGLYGSEDTALHSVEDDGFNVYDVTDIEDVTENSFTAVLTMREDPNIHLYLNIVNDNGVWKVDHTILSAE